MPELLPFGKEAKDNVAQLARWKRVLLYYVIVIEGSMQSHFLVLRSFMLAIRNANFFDLLFKGINEVLIMFSL